MAAMVGPRIYPPRLLRRNLEVFPSGEGSRKTPVIDTWDLGGCGERNDLVFGPALEKNVEVVKVAAARSEDHDLPHAASF